MDRFEKVKKINNITKKLGYNQQTVILLLTVTTDKGLTKLVTEFEEMEKEFDNN